MTSREDFEKALRRFEHVEIEGEKPFIIPETLRFNEAQIDVMYERLGYIMLGEPFTLETGESLDLPPDN